MCYFFVFYCVVVCFCFHLSQFIAHSVYIDYCRECFGSSGECWFFRFELCFCCVLSCFVSQIPGSDAQNPRYVVNMARMVRYIKSNLVKCTVRDKYGKETARIVEVLCNPIYLCIYRDYHPAHFAHT